jgi:hypothetical protein
MFRDEVRAATGMDEDDLSNTIVDRFLNISWWELSDKVQFKEREATIDGLSLAGTQSYSISGLSSDINSLVSVFLKVDDEWIPLKKRDYDQILDGQNDTVYARGAPEEYSSFGGSIFFSPIPDKQYSFRVNYLRTLADISVSGVSVPQVWDEYIILGAVSRVFRRKGDYQRSAAVRQERNELTLTAQTVKAKETVDYRMVGVQPMRQRYP